MSRAVLSLGSNVGDRLAHLQAALDALAAEVTVEAVSPVYETDPVGGPEQDDYLNAVAVVTTALDPAGLLGLAQRVEHASGRERAERWGPRPLDVDLVVYDAVVVDTPQLTLPHPRAGERAFVLVPWRDVEPGAVLTGRPVAELARATGAQGVRARPDLVLRVPA